MIARWAAASCLGLIASAFGRQPQSVRLESIDLQSDQRGALLTLSLSAPVSQHVFRLHNPERMVIDLPFTQRRAKLPPVSPSGPVLVVRSGTQPGQSLRLVVELRGPAPARLTPYSVATHYQLQIAFDASSAA